MTVQELISFGTMVGIPCIIGVTWLVTSLVRTQTMLTQMEARMVLLEANIHSIRNSLQAMSLTLARQEHHKERKHEEL
jgi:hypothetical protein